ncbi:N-acetylmuramoyl-L-alanine amidase [Cryptosporangium aurantiacum]|uniref:N-acetylmuramoyl-L-alanine amidase n=1 Tax=Cryptosporangium aurantiacum TaxID=134849 RepID=UPI000933CACD|nr:N-acetylmuramoyl-L-alanine amidase [Cryptosporangium aurantiacum]
MLLPGREAAAENGRRPPDTAYWDARAAAADAPVTLARRLVLGSAAAPKDGVRSLRAQPREVPLSDGHRLAPSGTPRVLRATTGGVPFAAVGVNWRRDPRIGEVSVAVRTRTRDVAKWTAWSTTEYHGAKNQSGRTGPGLLWTGDADTLEIVLTSLSGPQPTDVTVDLIDPGTAAADTAAALPAGGKPAFGATTLLAGLPTAGRQPTSYGNGVVRIFSRAAWGASPAYLRRSARYAPGVKAVVVHHTATTNNYEARDVPRIIRSIYYYMSVTEEYGDIGYNVLVDKFGRIWEGRAGGVDRAVIGVHAGGFNTGTSGVALIGDHADRRVTEAAREAIARYAAFKLGTNGVDPMSRQQLTGGPSTRYRQRTTVRVPAISPHQETSRTACPGEKGLAILPGVRARAKALIARHDLGSA